MDEAVRSVEDADTLGDGTGRHAEEQQQRAGAVQRGDKEVDPADYAVQHRFDPAYQSVRRPKGKVAMAPGSRRQIAMSASWAQWNTAAVRSPKPTTPVMVPQGQRGWWP
ncbi:hypothetical protein ACFHYO_14140 [Paracoccus panacisoli]|uniref:Uncharacterized protein n=1 Tax=Paracoccus panacisoli TaxID=1510163 RepID=A0ABV6T9G4_9RHOB